MTALLALLALSPARPMAQLAELTRPQSGVSRRETSTMREGKDGKYDSKAFPKGDLEEKSNFDNFRVPPGATHVLMDLKASGVITHIWMTFLGPEPQAWAKSGSANHQEMLLRIYWDGETRPSVEAPVGDFFANCFGKRSSVISVPVVVEDADSNNCFWQMPFRKAAKIEIVNQSDKPINLLYYNIDWIERPVPKDTPYFHAQYRQEYPAKSGTDYTILETKGKGHYVGTVMAVRTRSPMWFGEGDEKIYIDGEEHASIWGTGTEDYFLSAWGLQKTSTLYSGTPYFDQWGIVGGHTSAYRWHLNDPIVFQKGIKVTIEHFGWISPDENPKGLTNSWNEREDDYSSVAFWYQQGESTFAERAPAQRALPSIERSVVFAKDLSQHGEGKVGPQQLDLYDQPQLLYQPASEKDAWVEIPFRVDKKEPLRLLLNSTKSYDFGRYRAELAFNAAGPSPKWVKIADNIDLYSADVVNEEVHLLDFWPEPGLYTLRLTCLGKNPKSEGYYLGLESVRLRERRPRVSTFGYDKSKDWQTNPILYR
ncbi:MAG: glycoside hydrolase family 172 protein [Fimbriimonadales bacterium]